MFYWHANFSFSLFVFLYLIISFSLPVFLFLSSFFLCFILSFCLPLFLTLSLFFYFTFFLRSVIIFTSQTHWINYVIQGSKEGCVGWKQSTINIHLCIWCRGSNSRPPGCKQGALPTDMWSSYHFLSFFLSFFLSLCLVFFPFSFYQLFCSLPI